MDPVAGSLGAGLVSAIYLYSWTYVSKDIPLFGFTAWKVRENPIKFNHKPYLTFQVALAVHLVGWIIQFIGHGVFEGRAPALLDSLDQALITGPMFVLLEVLFFLGYRKKFHQKMMRQVKRNVALFKKSGRKHH